MATIYEWNPFGVALEITATTGSVTRISATQYTVKINSSWETYYSGAATKYGMKVTSGGQTIYIPKFTGNSESYGSGSLTGTYSISGNGSQTKTISVVFENYNNTTGDSKTYTINLDVSVPAWTSYAVLYNANGGSGAPSSQTKWKDQTLTLSSSEPNRTGYTFSKWNTKSDGTGTSYSSGGNYDENSKITLYAIWTENALTVNYYSNYATESFDGALNAVGKDKNVIVRTSDFYYDNDYSTNGHWDYSFSDSSTYLGRTGYTATGYWGTTSSGGTLVKQSTTYASGQAMAEAVGKSLKNGNASVNLYAQWQANTYNIDYEANGGTGNMNSQTVDWNETFIVSNSLFSREGYKFIGWNLHRNDNKWYVSSHGWMTEDEIADGGYQKALYSSGRELTFGESWINDDDTSRSYTFYAVWEISGVVYLDCSGSTFEPHLVYIDNGTDWNLYIAYIDNGTSWDIMS